LRIGYLTEDDPRDPNAWSGVNYSIFLALQKYVGQVIPLGPVDLSLVRKFTWQYEKLIKLLTGKRFDPLGLGLDSRWIGRIVQERLNESIDLIIAPTALGLAYIKTSIPKVFVHDATETQLLDYYPGNSNQLSISKLMIRREELKVMNSADLIVMSSEWARASVIQDLDQDPRKVVSIPFGSNYPISIPREEILPKTKREHCNLLFVGKDWDRKGGPLAFKTMLDLNNMGLETYLTIVGCNPMSLSHHPNVSIHKFLDTSSEVQRDKLSDLFREAHFFLMPSRQECAAIAFCDANNFGLPVITSDTGGITSFVKNGLNGYTLSIHSESKEYAKLIMEIYGDEERYQKLCEASRLYYEKKLNRKAWATELKKQISLVLRLEKDSTDKTIDRKPVHHYLV
jgi:glycosyltransferase involved in cell wall biosynthesis